MKETKLKIETWPLERVLNYARNARMHSDDQVKAIAASITEFGFINPCLVDPDGVLIAGHGRVLASRHLGRDTIPVIRIGHLTEVQIKALRIADDQLPQLATWNPELLRAELTELSTVGYDMPLLGFDDVQLVSFMSMPSGADPEDTPDVPVNPTSRRGDIWLAGHGHRVMCGNSLDMEDVALLLDGTVPDIANCDPPYGVSIVKAASVGGSSKPFGSKTLGRVHGLGKDGFGRVHGNAAKAIIQTGVYAKVIGDDSTDTAIGCYKVLKEVGAKIIVLWGGNYYANALPPSRCWFVWDKKVTGSFADVELAWTNCDQVARLFCHQWNGLMKASERGERRVHPTQKPVALAEWVLETASPRAKIYLDLFLGSGSSLIACERKNISCLGMEMSEDYCDVIVNRWEIYAKKEAILAGDGRTFAEISKARAKRLSKKEAVLAATAEPTSKSPKARNAKSRPPKAAPPKPRANGKGAAR